LAAPGPRWVSAIDALPRRVLGPAYSREMTWSDYLLALLALNGVVLALDFALLELQPALGGPRVPPDLALNIASSFVTNTDLQHYAGRMLTVTSQMLVITYTMFVAPASGLAASLAFMRGLARRSATIGNFYADFTRSAALLLALATASALLLVAMGVPQALSGGIGAVRLGPVASLESIKLLGNNGGGTTPRTPPARWRTPAGSPTSTNPSSCCCSRSRCP
jgi:K+-transporting ATPase, A chain